jgi:hypothetical protein
MSPPPNFSSSSSTLVVVQDFSSILGLGSGYVFSPFLHRFGN